jgi:molybdopterin-containing oxidoreductase family membrane subunit
MIASILVVIGMWFERFLIIVPTLTHPRFTFNWGDYTPTWVELTLTAGTFGYFVLLYAIFTRLFPIIAVWEYKEGLPLGEHGEPTIVGTPDVEYESA